MPQPSAQSSRDVTPPGTTATRLDELDGLRGLLALWVAGTHILCMCGFAFAKAPWPLNHVWEDFIFAGPAVECFMILSGFVISLLLDTKPQKYAGFIVGRFFRLYPVYVVCLLFGLATVWLAPFVLSQATWHDTQYFTWFGAHIANSHSHLGGQLALHATLLHGLATKTMLADSASTFLGPAWSISLEWQYYIVAPLLARWLRSPLIILAVSAAAFIAMRHTSAWVNPHNAFLPAQLPFFLAGIASYHFFKAIRALPSEKTSWDSAVIASLLGAAVMCQWHTITLVIWVLTLGCLVVRSDDFLARLLEFLGRSLRHPWLQRLGHASYPLYLVHLPLIITLLYVMVKLRPSTTATEALVMMTGIGLPLILIAAWILHRFVELPGMKLGRKLSQKLPGPG